MDRKDRDKKLVQRQICLSAVHVQLRWQVLPYDNLIPNYDMRPSRVPTAHGSHMWLRFDSDMEGWYAQTDTRIAPMQTQCRLCPSAAIAQAKKRAREVVLAFLLVGLRLKVLSPREICLHVLRNVNEEECDL